MTFDFTGGGCPPSDVPQVTPVFSQFDYDVDTYDHRKDGKTIKNRGCALTALCMALNSAGITCTPDELNDLLKHFPGSFQDNGDLVLPVATKGAALVALKLNAQFNDLKTPPGDASAPDVLKNALCQNRKPVIVQVPSKFRTGPHYVLVTQVDQNGRFSIIDPDPATTCTHLDCYGNDFKKFWLRGFVEDPPGDLSELVVSVGDALLVAQDPAGAQTGSSAFGQVVQLIPQSAYFLDAITDDVTGEPPDGFSSSIHVRQPAQGSYKVTVIGTQLTTYSVFVNAYSHDGAQQPFLAVPGFADATSSASFMLQYVSLPGAVSRVTRTATSASMRDDIRIARRLTLIDNDGIANALTSKIDASAAAAARGDLTASRNVLRAFEALVRAQTGKHLTELVAQILMEDADWLLNNTD